MALKPTEWNAALEEAEAACLAALCTILNLRAGTDAFLSVNPGKPDCAVFDIGRPRSGAVLGFPATKFHYRGQVDFYSRDRRLIQNWDMRLIGAMPIGTTQPTHGATIGDISNVESFRIAPEDNAIGEIATTELKTAKGVDGINVFTQAVQFDIVFYAGERDQ